jgi:hypothetical protein
LTPRRPSARERLILTTGGGLIMLALVVTRVAPTWLAWLEASQGRLVRARDAEAAARAILGDVPEVVDSLESRTDRFIDALDLLLLDPGEDEALASLGTLISESARLYGVRIESTELSMDSLVTAGIRLVRAQVHGATDGIGLSTWLAGIEGGRPLLRLSRLSVRQPTATASRSEPEELTFDVTFETLHFLRSASEEP